MAHLRKRYIEPVLKAALLFSPITGVLGHRQVGKTTLLESLVKDYVTFDDDRLLKTAEDNPRKFITGHRLHPLGIDESQMSPKLFPALKEFVRTHKKPGQFILSGSVRFTSRKAIRESLTGRIINLELLPFLVSEILNHPLPSFCKRAIEATSLKTFFQKELLNTRDHLLKMKQIKIYLERGGLPGICFTHSETFRRKKITDLLGTVLDRDIRLVYQTSISFIQILEFCRYLSKKQGEPLSFVDIKRETNLSFPTQKNLLYALEAVFLIRILPLEGGRKGFVLFFEDQAEANYLAQDSISREDQMTQLIYRNIRGEFLYRMDFEGRFFQYRTRGGALVPFAVRTSQGILGFIPTEDEEPSRSALFTANSFLKTYANSKILFVHQKSGSYAINDRMASVSVSALM